MSGSYGNRWDDYRTSFTVDSDIKPPIHDKTRDSVFLQSVHQFINLNIGCIN